MMSLLAPLRSFLALAALLMALSAVSPAAAQTPTNTPGSGCCLCLLCPGSSGFCTEGQTSTACATACGTLACDGFVFGFGEPCVNGSCSMVFPPTETPTPTATATATETDTPTATDTATETQTVTETPTVTDTPTPADTATVTDTPTVTLTPTTTDTPTPEDTPTATGTVTSTATPSDSPTVTGTATGTNTSTPTVTPSSTPTVTNTRTVTNTATATFTATPTNTATSTRTVTNTPTITNTATQTPTRTATPTNTPRPPLIGGLEPGDDTVDGSGQPNCNMLFVCALPPGGSTPSMTQPCGAPDTQIGSGSSNGSGSFSIPVTPAIGVNQCIYVYDQCNDIIGPVACARAAAPAPAMSPRMTIVAMLVLGAVALLSLLRLRRDI